MGSGCGSVGRAVASSTRDPWFESRHWQNFIYQLYNRKDENIEKEAGNGPSLKKEKKEIKQLLKYAEPHLLRKRTLKATMVG